MYPPSATQTSEPNRSAINSIHSDLLSQTESFLEELRVRQETQRREEEEAERQRKIQEERERREREVGERITHFMESGVSGHLDISTPHQDTIWCPN